MQERTVVSLKESVLGCQVPVSPLVAEALRLGFEVVSRQPILPWVHLLRGNVGKAVSGDFQSLCKDSVSVDKVSEFLEYRQALADKLVVVRSLSDRSKAKVIRQSDSSRYFGEGRYRMKARIVKRMGGFFNTNGLLVSCTYDPKLLSLDEAWADVGSRSRSFLDNVNRWRRREGMVKVRGIRVVEAQPGTGYPHIHIAFPKLRWLAPVAKLTDWWGQAVNSVDVQYRDNFSPAGYVCKYVSKLEGWSDEAMAEIWFNHTRIYSMAHDYYIQLLDKRVPEWKFLDRYHVSVLSMPALMCVFDTVLCDKDLMSAGFT